MPRKAEFPGVRPMGEHVQIRFLEHGKRRSATLKIKPTKANLRYASNMRARILDEIARGVFDYEATFPSGEVPSSGVTMGDGFDRLLERAKHALAKTTYESYKKAIEAQLRPAFGHLEPRELTASRIEDWILSNTHLSAKWIKNCMVPLRRTLKMFAKDDLIAKLPTSEVTLRELTSADQRAKDEPDPFNKAEVRAILDAAEGPTRNMVQFMFATGFRPQETLGLSWADVYLDADAPYITVRNARVRGENKEPKTYNRSVKPHRLHKSAIEALSAQREHTAHLPADDIGVPVFVGSNTRRRHSDSKHVSDYYWKPLLKKAGVRYRTMGQTRHTYASNCLRERLDWHFVKDQLGHKSLKMLIEHYSSYVPDDRDAAYCPALDFLGEK